MSSILEIYDDKPKHERDEMEKNEDKSDMEISRGIYVDQEEYTESDDEGTNGTIRDSEIEEGLGSINRRYIEDEGGEVV